MLKPKYLERLPDAMVELYSQVEQDILADMAARIMAFDDFIPAAQWQYKKLIEMGNYHSFVVKALAARMGRTEAEVKRIMKSSCVESLRFDDSLYQNAGLDPPPLAASPTLRAVLESGLKSTMGLFENLTSTTANTSTRQLELALDRAWLQIYSGAFSHQEATRMAVKELAAAGLESVRYPSGHVDHLDVVVRRAILTGVNQTALKMQEARAEQMGCDLVEVTAHAGARVGVGIADHAGWQGKVYSRSGTHPKYPPLVEKTGYGTGPGLGGWNCRHSFFPFVEGVSEPAYTDEELEELNAPKYEYNGQILTEYEATRRQRYIERQIRRWKREEAAMKAAGLDAAESAAKIHQWQDAQTDFLQQTGLKRQYERERVEGPGKAEMEAADFRRTIMNQKDYEQLQRKIGKNAPNSLEDFTRIKYTDSEEWGRLIENKRLFEKIDSTATYSVEYKAKMKQTYQYFKDLGFVFREHALNRVLGQKSGKDKFSFSQGDLLSVLQLEPNFRQADGKLIRFYNGMAVVSASDTGEIVSIVIRSKAKADWEAL